MLKFLVFALIVVSQASVLRIPYTGGKQTGIFAINAAGKNGTTPPSYSDTVIMDSSLLITYFMSTVPNYSAQCYLIPAHQYGLAIAAQNGMLGKLGKADTLWQNAKVFSDTLLPLDSVPKTGFVATKDLGNSPKGLNIDTLFTDGVCTVSRFNMTTGYHNALYFKFNHGSGDRYGKMMFYEYRFVSGLVSGGNNPPSPAMYTTLMMSYTISSTKDLDSGPVGIFQIKSANTRDFLPSTRYFDLNGRTQKVPDRAFPSTPLLPKP